MAEPDDAAASRVKASRIGFDFVASILVMGALGYGLDRWLGSSPWGLLGLLLLGVIVAFANIWRALNGYGQQVGFRK